MSYDVIIVGAGPIGLATAVELKLLDPSIQIVIYEERKRYTRDNTLHLDKKALDTFHDDDDGVMTELKAEIQRSGCIQTLELQQRLQTIALGIGVTIIKPHKVHNYTQLINENPTAKVMIGADGAKSEMRRQLLAKEDLADPISRPTTKRYNATVSFEVPGDHTDKRIGKFKRAAVMSAADAIGQESCKLQQNDCTKFTFNYLISREQFLALQEATFRDPIRPFAQAKIGGLEGSAQSALSQRAGGTGAGDLTHIEEAKNRIVPKELMNSITLYLNNKLAGIKLSRDEKDAVRAGLTISTNPLQAYVSNTVVRRLESGQHLVLVGDAALGLVYNAGLTAGLQCAAYLGQQLAAGFRRLYPLKAPAVASGATAIVADGSAIEATASTPQFDLTKYSQTIIRAFRDQEIMVFAIPEHPEIDFRVLWIGKQNHTKISLTPGRFYNVYIYSDGHLSQVTDCGVWAYRAESITRELIEGHPLGLDKYVEFFHKRAAQGIQVVQDTQFTRDIQSKAISLLHSAGRPLKFVSKGRHHDTPNLPKPEILYDAIDNLKFANDEYQDKSAKERLKDLFNYALNLHTSRWSWRRDKGSQLIDCIRKLILHQQNAQEFEGNQNPQDFDIPIELQKNIEKITDKPSPFSLTRFINIFIRLFGGTELHTFSYKLFNTYRELVNGNSSHPNGFRPQDPERQDTNNISSNPTLSIDNKTDKEQQDKSAVREPHLTSPVASTSSTPPTSPANPSYEVNNTVAHHS